MKSNKLAGIAIALAIVLIGLVGYLIIYTVTHNDEVEKRLRNQITAEVTSHVKSGEKGAKGANGISITGPRGLQGYPGPKGDTGAQGAMGVQGTVGVQGSQGIQGSTGQQGETGQTGAQGEPGADGRQTEFRCDPENNDYEYRYVGDDGWIIIERNSNACKSSPI